MAQTPLTPIPFPIKGYSTFTGFDNQPPGTSALTQNVLGFDPANGRLRGSQRWGQARLINAQVNGSNQIQDINQIALSNTASPSLSTMSTRTHRMLVMAGGSLYYTPIPATSYTLATNGASWSSTAPFIDSAVYLACNTYYADGTNYYFFDSSTNTATAWTESTGNSLPANGADTPRLIAAWNDRIILAGIRSDPTNYFASAVGDPTDFAYAPTIDTTTKAFAGNNSAISQCPDIINAIIPLTNGVLWFGCDHAIYQMSGDPTYGGQIDIISQETGMAFGRAWCRDPNGSRIYFFGQQGGLWAMSPDGSPMRISGEKIDEQLADVDIQGSMIRLVWESRHQHVLIFITPLDGSATTHFAFDTRNQAFYPIVFADTDLNPTATFTLDGDAAGDRVTVLGGQDGRVRAITYAATNDDDVSLTAIDSYVWLGPIKMKGDLAFRLTELQLSMASGSSDVSFDLFMDNSAEAAFNSSSLLNRTLSAGRNPSIRQGGFGNAMYIRLRNNTASQTWAYEAMRYGLKVAGRTAQRRI